MKRTITGSLLLILATSLSLRADDDRVGSQACDQVGVEQTASWTFKLNVTTKLWEIVGLGVEGSTTRTATAKCKQTSSQVSSSKGTKKPKAADGRGSDACAKAVVHPPTDTPAICKDVTFPCGSGAAETAPKPSE